MSTGTRAIKTPKKIPAQLGVEPGLFAPEARVLPLHHGAPQLWREEKTRRGEPCGLVVIHLPRVRKVPGSIPSWAGIFFGVFMALVPALMWSAKSYRRRTFKT